MRSCANLSARELLTSANTVDLPQELSELRFHIEHVIPRQHGGSDDADNLALACPDCNLRKGPT
jgi:5-methylcytosine-specific restriction endonuclease McrA